MRIVYGISTVLLLFATVVFAQEVVWRVTAPDSIRAGEEGEIQVVFDVAAPWYIYVPGGGGSADGMVETRISFEATDVIQTAEPRYPEETSYASEYLVYEGEGVTITQPFRVRPRTAQGQYRLDGIIEYQVCKFDICLPPARERVRVEIGVR